MILAVALAVQLASTYRPPPPDTADVPALAARYRRECGAAVGADGEACRTLRRRLERRLYDDLRRLYTEGGVADRETLRVAARAAWAPLAAFGLHRLAERLEPADEPLVIAALDSPYGLVRRTATGLLLQLTDPRGVRLYQRSDPDPPDPNDPGVLPDEPPTAAQLGVPLPADARFRFFASGRDRAFFTTTEPPARVLARLAPAPAQTPAEADVGLARPPRDAPALRAWLAGGGDRGALKAAWRRRMRLRAWLARLLADEGIAEPRVVVLDEPHRGGIAAPRTAVVVFEDRILGGTALVLPTPRSLGRR